jgi:ribosome-interacting GTPase 1
VNDLAAMIHKDLREQIKFARVWGDSAFDGQTVQREHVLADGDVVEIRI